MSTRATYHFTERGKQYPSHGPVSVYIHYDGYPEGAAHYFWSMHHDTEERENLPNNKRGSFATRFIRANQLAEITESHEAHGDTEYRYTLHGNGLLHAYRRTVYGDKSDWGGWQCFFQGQYWEFINEYGDFEPIVPVKGQRYNEEETPMSLPEIREEINYKCRTIEKWRKNGNEGSYNYTSTQKEVDALIAVLDEHQVTDPGGELQTA